MPKVQSRLIVGESLFDPGGVVPLIYVGVVESNLLTEYPDIGTIIVTEERLQADENSPEPYALLTASGEV